jgi:hypothetical protein
MVLELNAGGPEQSTRNTVGSSSYLANMTDGVTCVWSLSSRAMVLSREGIRIDAVSRTPPTLSKTSVEQSLSPAPLG